MSESFVLDDIIAEATKEQYDLLVELWLRIDVLTNGTVKEFSEASFSDILSRRELPIDVGFLQNKQIKQALLKTDPASILATLRGNVKHEDPDLLVIRFLRARGWNLDAAFLMLLNAMTWRMGARIEERLAGGDAQLARGDFPTEHERKVAAETLAMFKSGQSFLHGADRGGHPVIYIRARMHDPRRQGKDAFQLGSILQVENMRMVLRPPVTCVSIVFDLTGFGLANMNTGALQGMSGGLQDNYPECLGQVYVFAAPWIFGVVWQGIRRWLNPVVASKVHFVSTVEELSQYIARDAMPKFIGGESDYEWKWIEPEQPAPWTPEQLAARDQIQAERARLLDEYLDATRKWAVACRAGEADRATALLDDRHALVLRLRTNYWQLDPYVRARGLLDREGVIASDGRIHLD